MSVQLEQEPLLDVDARSGEKSVPGQRSARGRIVYLVRREGLTSVFASQVARRMGAVAAAGFEVDVGVFTPVGQWTRGHLREKWRQTLESLPESLAGRVWRLPSLPSRVDWPMAEARVLRWWLRRIEGRGSRVEGGSRQKRASSGGNLIIQCRNATVTRMALWARRGLPGAKVIFDCRGVVDHEYLYERGLTFATAPARELREAERLGNEQREAARESDAVFCVSERMVEYLVREYGIAREKCVVAPCCVDVDLFAAAACRREEMRRRLGFEGKLVVCYCGSLARYQLPRESLRLFKTIREIEPRAHFYAVTTAPDAMRSAAREEGIGDGEMTVVSVSADEVPAYLSAADVGLLLRERCAVNEVASPVKFGEYLASGLPVVMSEGIGDYSELVRRERVGVILNRNSLEAEEVQSIRSFLADWATSAAETRLRCRSVAEEVLDFQCHLYEIAAVYHELSNTPANGADSAACLQHDDESRSPAI